MAVEGPLTPDLDVREWAKQWGLDPLLVQAVVQAEGDIVKAVACSVPSVHARGEALMILCRTLTHRLWEHAKGLGLPGEDFVSYFSRTWAPVGAANDPTRLNENFEHNLRTLWLGASQVVA